MSHSKTASGAKSPAPAHAPIHPRNGDSFDLIVIGSGPAGQRAALQAAKFGHRALVIEESSVWGGACVEWGTLPSKSFRESVYRYSMKSRGSLGADGQDNGDEATLGSRGARKGLPLPQIGRLLLRRDRVVEGESTVVLDQLSRNRIVTIQGRGRLLGGHEVEVSRPDGSRMKFSGRFIVISTGARPVPPAHLEVDGTLVHDSNTILSLGHMPKTMIVLGAGIIGCEYASMFSMAGTQVHLVDKRTEILATFDREIVGHLKERFDAQGMEVSLGCEAVKIERKPSSPKSRGGVSITLSNGKKIKAEVALIAMGRTGNTDDLGLEKVGLAADARGLLNVDAHFRTRVPYIYAVGDVIGLPALASTAFEQGRIAAAHALEVGDPAEREMPSLFPYGIYTIPEISTLGKTEEEVKSAGIPYVIGRARYRELARGHIVGDRWGLLKLVVDRRTMKMLGVHIVGEAAANLIHIGQAVMDHDGDIRYFIRSVFNYPTLAEGYKTAAFHAINQIRGNSTRA